MDMPRTFYPELIREFYANMRSAKFGNLVSTVRDKKLTLNPPLLHTILKIDSSSEVDVYTAQGFVSPPDLSITDQLQLLMGSVKVLDTNPPSTTVVTPMAYLLFKVCRSNMLFVLLCCLLENPLIYEV